MLRESGNKNFPIWLLGDSEPINWKDKIELPFDSRHPIRHNIWTSVQDIVQDIIYRSHKLRIDTSLIFIRNAIGDPVNKPKSSEKNWRNSIIVKELTDYKNYCNTFHPKIIFTFGSFAYEFGRRALNGIPIKPYIYWGTENLGSAFRDKTNNFYIDKTNLIPLLHRSIAGGKFLQSHVYFCDSNNANYFNYVGRILANIILTNKENLNIFIK